MKMKFYPTHADMNDDNLSHLFDRLSSYDFFMQYEHKFIVMKLAHINECLDDTEKDALYNILQKLKNDNEYWVINKDEPYANDVEKCLPFLIEVRK